MLSGKVGTALKNRSYKELFHEIHTTWLTKEYTAVHCIRLGIFAESNRGLDKLDDC